MSFISGMRSGKTGAVSGQSFSGSFYPMMQPNIAYGKWRRTWYGVSRSVWILPCSAFFPTTISGASPNRRRCGKRLGHRAWHLPTTCFGMRTISQAEVARTLNNRACAGSGGCLSIEKSTLKLHDKKNPTAVEAELQKVISAFAQLQEDRYKPDYDVGWIWSRTDVTNTLAIADEAFKT